MKTNIKQILFKTEMVKSILSGRKIQTRNIKGLEFVNVNPDSYVYDGIDMSDESCDFHFFEKLDGNGNFTESYWTAKCPVEIGDILWVRESFSEFGEGFVYRADNLPEFEDLDIKWKPAIFMPKEACRLFLKITSVRAERLQDISEQDTISEGVSFIDTKNNYISLWNETFYNDNWDKNPFVWVYTFEITDKPENF